MKVADFDIVYISYDEPNAEENYQDLLTKIPTAKRVHGVKGFDASHKAAADLADTDFLFIIDGDNKIVEEFLSLEIDTETLRNDSVYSWGSKNIINSLVYGNGGIKLWPKKLLSEIDCHDSGKSTDWCFEIPYIQMNDWYSYSINNASPFQAFRSGFREGAKLCLDKNGKVFENVLENINVIPEGNLRRLVAWMSVGSDVTNGLYAIFGARLGFLKAICESDFDFKIVSDYEWLRDYWNGEMSYVRDGYYKDHFLSMAADIRRITGLPVSDLNSFEAQTMRYLMFSPKRLGIMNEFIGESKSAVNNSLREKEI
jgi:hypothetical protein